MIILNITNYNKSEFINELFDSLYNQVKDAEDIRINWIDDGSTDNSVEVASAHPLAALPFFKIIKHESNKWVAASRNTGLAEINKGDWVTYIDGDDRVKPHYIEMLRKYVADGKYDVYVYDYDLIPAYEDTSVQDVEKGLNLMTWSRLYRADLILNHNISFDEEGFKEQGYGEDAKFNEIITALTDKIIDTRDVIYEYRWGVKGSLALIATEKIH